MAPRKVYTPEQMGKAIEAVRGGAKVAVAALRFGVPRITLYNKVTGKTLLGCTMGPNTVLTETEEQILVKWLLALSEKHFPITKDNLLDSVQRIMVDQKRENPFTNNRPGKKWFQSFLKRHPELVVRTPENLSSARDNVTEGSIRNWFEEIGHYLEEKGLKHIVKEPSRIFNADESAFFLSPKPGTVITKKGEKHLYSSCGDDKENLTVLFTANAAGKIAPPMIVFNYERIPANIAASVPEEWAIGKSESGWMCGSTFYEYITNIFNPWIEQMNIEKPVLFFVDGHKSHLTFHLSKFCSENGIEIIALFPNSTHILQPLDLSVFRPLKVFWKKAVNDWRMQNSGRNLKKENFGLVLQTAVMQLSTECVKNGFRAGGLFPFGPDYIDMTKIKDTVETTVKKSKPALGEYLTYLESEIVRVFSPVKLNLFNKLFLEDRSTMEDIIPEGDLSLYVLWAKSKAEYNMSNLNIDPLPKTKENDNETQIQENRQSRSNFDDIAPTEISFDENTATRCNNTAPNLTRDEDQMGDSSLSVLSVLETLQDETHNQIPKVAGEQVDETSYANFQDTKHQQSQRLNTENTERLVEVNKDQETNKPIYKTPMKNTMATSEIPEPVNQKTSMDAALGVIIPSPFKRSLFWPEDDGDKKKKRLKKEKVPYAVTGKAWQDYHERKKIEKQKQQEEKAERARKRLENKLLREKNVEDKKNRLKKDKKKKAHESTSEDSDLEVPYMESEDSCGENDENYFFAEYMKQRKKCQTAASNSSDKDTGDNNMPIHQVTAPKAKNEYRGIIPGSYVIVKYEGEHFPGKVENVDGHQYEVSTMVFSTGRSFKWPDSTDKIWYRTENVIEKIDEPICIKRGFYKVKEMDKYLSFLYEY